MSHILVTGGAGFIGSHTCKRLRLAGHEPIVIDDLRAGHQWAVRWGPFVQGDIGDVNLLREVFSKYRIEAVIHFAATASIPESEGLPISCLQNNVGTGLALLKVMEEKAVRAIVFSSSCALYGDVVTIPIKEDRPKCPVSVYGASKYIFERILIASGITFGALRYFNAAGADPDNEIGESHNPETHLIPLALAAAIKGPLRIFGTDHPTPDGTAVRDFVHVSDLADAHLRALELLMDGGRSLTVNLGSGIGYSVKEVLKQVEATTGTHLSIIETEKRSADAPMLVADPQLARKILGWSPSRSGLDTIVDTAWRWLKR